MSRAFFRNTAIVGATTLLSRVTGLIREIVQLAMIPTVALEAFVLANQIPNLLRRLFAEGAFSQAFVPVVAEYRTNRTTEEVRALVDSVAGTLGIALFAVTAIGIVIAPVIVVLCAPGFVAKGEGQFELATQMLRWTLPYLLFVSLTAMAAGVLNSYHKFALPAFGSVVLNVTIIVFAAFLSPRFEQPVLALAIGVFVGGLLQLAMQIPALLRLGVLRRPRWNLQHEAVRRIGRLLGPAVIGSSMGQLNFVLSTAIASLLADASMTWLYAADRLVEFPLGVFSIALATVILPSLSAQHARSSPDEFSATLAWAIRLVCLIVVPASVALFVLAGPLTVVMYYRGEFTAQDVEMTRLALMAFSFALFGWSLIKVLAPGYYARQDTKRPVQIAVQALGLTLGLNLLAIAALFLLDRRELPGMHVLLAITNAVGAMFNAAWLYAGLRRNNVLYGNSGNRRMLMRIAAASGVMALVLWWFGGRVEDWLAAPISLQLLWLAGLVTGGLGVYFGCLWLLGARSAQFSLQPPTVASDAPTAPRTDRAHL